MSKYEVLLVDDDNELLAVYSKILKLKGIKTATAETGHEALEFIMRNNCDVVVSDIIMPKMDGMQLLSAIKEIRPFTEVIMLTAEGSISGAVESVKKGAFSYLVKPADIDELISNILKARELAVVRDENTNLKQHIENLSNEKCFIGNSKVACGIRDKAKIIGATDSTVLITGESGTGKEIVANLIHKSSRRANKPFVCINCGALNENLIESELFGHEKGAFTGADKLQKGRFETADGGTLFFDEIGELSLSMQVKLLRVLQEKKFERVGGIECINSDFRLICATNRNLKEEVAAKRFREDLYYRINILPIEIPPLRDRKEDLELLCNYFVKECAIETNRHIEPLSQDILAILGRYNWPGNVRELKNIVERLVVLSVDGHVKLDELPGEIIGDEKVLSYSRISSLKCATKQFEKEYIVNCMRKNNNNVTKAAEEMGIARKNLYKKLSEYEIKY